VEALQFNLFFKLFLIFQYLWCSVFSGDQEALRVLVSADTDGTLNRVAGDSLMRRPFMKGGQGQGQPVRCYKTLGVHYSLQGTVGEAGPQEPVRAVAAGGVPRRELGFVVEYSLCCEVGSCFVVFTDF
jgi:hypothetical protein